MCKLFESATKRRQREALERARQRKAQAQKVKISTPVYDWNDHNIDVKGEK